MFQQAKEPESTRKKEPDKRTAGKTGGIDPIQMLNDQAEAIEKGSRPLHQLEQENNLGPQVQKNIHFIDPATFFSYDQKKKEAQFNIPDYESLVLEMVTRDANYRLNDEEMMPSTINVAYNKYLMRAAAYLKSHINGMKISPEEKKDLKRLITSYQVSIEERIKPHSEEYVNIEVYRQQKIEEARRRRWEFERLRIEYQRAKTDAICEDLMNIAIGAAGLAVTIFSGGTGTMFYVSIVGSSLALGGGTAKLILDSKGKMDIRKWIPTDYSDIVGITLLYSVGDSEGIRRVNALFDVAEGIIFIKFSTSTGELFHTTTNVIIQGVEVHNEFKDGKEK